MKKKILILVPFLLAAFCIYGQAPGIFNYQGVARNSVGNVLVNQNITLRLTVHDGAPAGPVVYQESRSLTTNPFGLFNVQVGSPGATNVSGTVLGVNWGVGAKYIQVEIDPNGGTTFINIGTAQMASVPYSLYSLGAGDIVLPFNKTQADPGILFTITNSGAGAGSGAIAGFTNGGGHSISGVNTGTGRGGNFVVANAASTADALRAETNGTGASWAIRGISTGTNGAGLFVQSNPTNTANNLQSNQAGLGRSGLFNSTNAASTANAVDINVAGTGFALQLSSTNATPRALRTVGGLQLTGINEGLNRVLTTDAAGNATWQTPAAAGTLSLPIDQTQAENGFLLRLTNSGTTSTSSAIEGVTNSTAANAFAMRGTVSSTAPGGFSSALRGVNNGTGGLGIGVWGSHAGSGWGVYGVTPSGLGVYGNSTGAGYGVFGNSTSGTGIYGTSTDGMPGQFVMTNNTNTNPALSASTLSDGHAILGATSSTTASVAAIRGEVSSTSPGGFSSALRGVNNGTGGLGVGVWGSQGGSGWGVYGVTPSGLGVYGNSTGAGYGVFANSTTGIGLFATSTDGDAANFTITNNANSNEVVNASSSGNGTVVNVSTTGAGKGVFASTGAGFAVHGVTTSISSAGIIGDNNGGGEAVVGRNNSDVAGAVVGRNDGGGYGVRGFIGSNATGTAVGVLGQIGGGGSKGRAGRFENSNLTNEFNAFEVESIGNGNIPDRTLGNASNFRVNNTNSVAAAVRGQVNTIFGNFGAAAIFGEARGTGGFAGLFYQQNPAGNGTALVALSDGNGNAITANAANTGDGVETNVDGSGNALYAWVPTFGTGRAGRFNIFNDANTNDVITVTTVGNGTAGNFFVDRVTGTSPAVRGEVNSQFANFGTAGIYGISSGTGGFAGLFHASNPAGNGPALIALADGNGNAITANAANNGDGVETTVDGTGNALYAWVPTFATGRAARMVNFNNGNTNPVLTVETHSVGNIAIFKAGDPATVNVARIDASGRGFFNNGTQVGGADVAEMFDVNGNVSEFEPGDILAISTSKDRAVEKSSTPYSTLVAGVYATKPGVIMSEEHIDSDLSGKVPMGVIGVIPTKVCTEGGSIRRGDLLVTSSIPGVAMKADPEKVKPGQVLGKALADYDGTGVGMIKVLVSIK